MDESDLQALRVRMGDEHLGQRLRAQVDRTLHIVGMGHGPLHLENFSFFINSVGVILRITGLLGPGRRNATRLALTKRTVPFRGLPPAFESLRILQVSDLHLDGHPGFGMIIAEAIAGARFDLALLTGDYRFYDTGGYEQLAHELDALIPALACPLGIYGILGNHDFVEMVPLLEKAGVRMLLNEAACLRRDGDDLWLAGVDDPHFYGQDDIPKALQGVPGNAPRILMAHSPEIIPAAAGHGFGLYLTGHTHGGQICLPGRVSLYRNVRCKRREIAGAWRQGDMEGYTSYGAGASGVFARFFCPPEVVIHELRRA